jgi:hypothetical protein
MLADGGCSRCQPWALEWDTEFMCATVSGGKLSIQPIRVRSCVHTTPKTLEQAEGEALVSAALPATHAVTISLNSFIQRRPRSGG